MFILDLQSESEHFKFFCNDADKNCIKDLESEVEVRYSKIISDLGAKLDYKIKVYIYDSVETFHEAIGYKDAPDWVVGIADGNDIKMVSPLNPGKVHDYNSLIKVVVHEFTHIAVSNIAQNNNTIPRWLNDGIACYEAEQISLDGLSLSTIDSIPSLDDLNTYDDNRFGDINGYLFSDTIVDFIIDNYSINKLNQFICYSSNFIEVFGISKEEFENDWKNYLEESY